MLGFWSLGEAALGTGGSIDAQASPAGVSATGVAGTVAKADQKTLSGAAANGGVGQISGVSISSVTASAVAGAVTASLAVAAPGVAGAAVAGAVTGRVVNSVAASAVAGVISPSPRGIVAGVAATGAVAALSRASSLTAAGATATAATGVLTPAVPNPTVGVATTAAASALARALVSPGGAVYATAAAGPISLTASLSIAAVFATGTAGAIAKSATILTGSLPISADGVLGLEPLGMMLLGGNAPQVSWFSGVASAGGATPMVAIVNNSVFATTAVGAVTANPAGNPAGVSALGGAGLLGIHVAAQNMGVASTALASAPAPRVIIPPTWAVSNGVAGNLVAKVAAALTAGQAYGLAGTIRGPLAAVNAIAAGAAGKISEGLQPISAAAVGLMGYVMTQGADLHVIGVVSNATPGSLLYLAPSSSIGLTGTPDPGGVVQISFPTISVAVSVTVMPGQTIEQVMAALAGAINSNSGLIAARVIGKAAGQILTISQPTPAVLYPEMLLTGT